MRPRSPAAIFAAVALVLAFGPAPAPTLANPLPSWLPAPAPPAVPPASAPLPTARSATPAAAAPASAATTLDGTWREFGLLQVERQCSIYDAAHDELLSIGGSRSSNWALPLAGAPAWQALPAMSSPYHLDSRDSSVDPATGLVYFLSLGGSGTKIGTLDPRTGAVAIITASGAPPVEAIASILFDPATQRVLVYVGYDINFQLVNQVWALDLLPAPAWTLLAPAGTPPPPLYQPYLVLDPVRRNLVIPDALYSGSADIWTLNLDGPPQWSNHATNGLPNGANLNPYVYDAASDRVWTLDGAGGVFSLSPSTWQWTQVSPSGAGPAARIQAGLAVDAQRHRLIVSGGRTLSGSDTFADTWALPLDGASPWTVLVPDVVRPPIRGGASDGYDASRRRLVVFGGSDEVGGFRNDTWGLDLGVEPTWSPLATQGGPPPARYWHAGAWDEVRDQMLVYGGYYGDSYNPLGDLWALSFAGPVPTWSPLTPSGTAPVARMLTTLVRDPSRDRFLLFFGWDGHQALADVWELTFSPAPAWRHLAPAGAPPPARSAAMAAYDSVRDRVIVFGGGNSASNLDDTWALQFGSGDGTWQPLAMGAHPSARNLGLLRLDTAHDRLLLFGGYGVYQVIGNTTYIQWLDDTWAMDLGGTPAWHALSPAGFTPPARDRAVGAYDPLYDRLLIATGLYGMNDTWALTFGDEPTPTLLALASSDVTADRVRLVWAGADPGQLVTAWRRVAGGPWASLGGLAADGEGLVTLEDRDVTPGATLEYRLGVAGPSGEAYFGATMVQVPTRALALAARVAGGRVSFALELPSGEPASLALFDLAGRRVWSRDVGGLGAGTHEVDLGGATLPPALYFARLVQGAARRDARVIVTR